MSYFILNAATGTIAAGIGTAGFVFTGIPSEKTETEKAATRAIEEVQSNTTKVPAPLRERTISVMLNPQDEPALLIHWRTNMKRHIPASEETINTVIELLKALTKIYISTQSINLHVIAGIFLATSAAHRALHHLGGIELDNSMFEVGYVGTYIGTIIPGLFIEMLQRLQIYKNPTWRMMLSFLAGAATAPGAVMRNEALAPKIGAAITSAAFILKAAETMEDATESYGGFILGSAIGISVGALIAMLCKKAKLRGGDERAASLGNFTAMYLWFTMLYFNGFDSENMSTSDLILAWTAISVLSGLIAATVVPFLPRQ